ncbi:MAG TPA: hypothetical protein VE196_06185, partial [Pseudonocardiaceae bacterium]|nr:hypothetical protein [Pseudonocardiaceae bacterium]
MNPNLPTPPTPPPDTLSPATPPLDRSWATSSSGPAGCSATALALVWVVGMLGLLTSEPATPAAVTAPSTVAVVVVVSRTAAVLPTADVVAWPAPAATPVPDVPDPTPPPPPTSAPSAPVEPNTAPDAPGAPAGSSPASPPATPGQQQVDPAQEQSWIERQVTNAINGWLSTLAAGALDPLARLAGALIDPKYWIGIEQVHQLWLNSAVIANGVYVLLVLAGGVLVMTHQTVQTRYAVKQVAPRLVLGWVAANLSWALIGAAVQFALTLALALAGNGMTPAEILVRLLAANFAGGPIFLILLILIVTVLAVALVLGLIVTEALFLVLVISAPLALCLHALPQTEAVALLWWRCMGAALSVPVLDGLILALLGRIVLTPGSFGAFFLPSFVTAAGTLLHLLVVTALLWLMLKIPRAVFRAATATQHRRGRGVIRTVLRSALIYSALRTGGIGPALGTAAKTAGKTGPLATAIGALLGTKTKPGTGKTPGGTGTPGGPNPYQQTHTTGGGQYLLPLRGVRPRSRRLAGEGPPNPANPTATRRYLAAHSGGTATATGPR